MAVRSAFSAVLIVLACLLAPLALAAVWVADLVGDTDRYVATMAPLARDPAVQAGVTNRVTDQVVRAVDVNGLVGDLTGALGSVAGDRPRLAGALGSLAAPLENGFAGFVHTAVAKVVQSRQFAALWEQANRAAHTAAVQALTGERGVLNATDQSVTLDLGPVVDRVREQLVAGGFQLAAKIPEVRTSYTIADTGSLAKARKVFRLLDRVGDWLPVIVVALLAAGVAAATHRRRTLIRAALGVFAGTAVLGIALWIFRHVYLTKLPTGVDRDAAAAVYDTLVRFLRRSVRTVASLVLVCALAAYFTGPGRFAVFVRTLSKDAATLLRRVAQQAGLRGVGGLGGWTRRVRRWIAWIAVGGAVLWFVLLDHPSVGEVVWLSLGVLLVLFALEVLDPGEAPAGDLSGG